MGERLKFGQETFSWPISAFVLSRYQDNFFFLRWVTLGISFRVSLLPLKLQVMTIGTVNSSVHEEGIVLI